MPKRETSMQGARIREVNPSFLWRPSLRLDARIDCANNKISHKDIETAWKWTTNGGRDCCPEETLEIRARDVGAKLAIAVIALPSTHRLH